MNKSDPKTKNIFGKLPAPPSSARNNNINMHAEEDGEIEYLQNQAQTANIMDQFGSDLAEVGADGLTLEKRREQRIKRGECPNCRRKTHKVSRNPFGSRKREPLTVDGEVVNGHCLRCKPIEGYTKRPAQPAIPDTLEVPMHSGMELVTCEDEMTVASELTMDPFLTAPSIDHRSSPGGLIINRYVSSSGRHLMASHFESVSEETPMTDFGRHAEELAGHIDELQNERREREREIVREQEESHGMAPTSRRQQNNNRRQDNRRADLCNRRQLSGGRLRISEEDTEESEEEEDDELWENHEYLLRHMENHQQHQLHDEHEQQQQFHPLAVQHNFSNSEQSMSLDELKDDSVRDSRRGGGSSTSGHDTPGGGGRNTNNEEQSHTSSFSASGAVPMKQNFHPLSRMAHFSNSERSISLNDATSHASSSVQSSDSDRILRLCQGSRSSLMVELEKSDRSPTRDSSPITKIPSNEGYEGGEQRRSSSVSSKKRGSSSSTMRKPRGDRGSDSNRFSLKLLSSSPHCSDNDELEEGNNVKPVSRLSTSSDRSDGSHRKVGSRDISSRVQRKVGRPKESNRFSLTRLDSKGRQIGGGLDNNTRFSLEYGNDRGPQRRSRRATGPPNLEMEMNASKNWDSMDILRDAAAEANGDMDAAVDALFGLVGSKNQKPSGDETSAKEDNEGGRDEVVDNMFSALSKESSAHEEAAIATTIKQRRKSVSSTEGSAIRLSTIKDIPIIIQTVKSRPTDKKCTERAFQSLFLLATDPDPEGSMARKEILANGGMETLTSAIWDFMQNSQVLLALFHALWAISVFNGSGEKSKASVVKIQECGVLEGLLFAMQSHDKDLSIQESGCDLITRLTGLLPNDTPEFKSAVVLLSTNMQSIDTGTKAYSSCLDALNSLCQLSDENKREFAKAGNDCHGAIIRGLTSSESPSLETRELACQLFWCVTSDRTAVSVLSMNGVLSKKIIDALKSVPRAKSSVHFYGAACGTLANLALDPNNHSKMTDLGVVPILCEAIYVYDFSEDVISAACTALANLSASRDIRKAIVSQGGIPALFSAMKSTSDNADVQSETFRALHNLCESSSDGKQAIVADLEIIITAFFRHEGVKYIQQITCSILCRLSADEKCRESMKSLSSTYSALAKIMKTNSRKKLVQKSACSALQNLSMDEEVIPILLSKGFDSLVIDAMDAYSDCEELQESACTFLMNMGSNSPEASVEICSGEGIHCIVKSMQTIPTSATLQQASCGALYAITKGDAHKNMAISAGAVDAVICLVLVHPTDIKVLENAVNVLTNLSSLKKGTKTIADAGGISTVIETMRSNPSSTGLILSGSRFIQNMALSNREYANEALGGITPILGCMDEHPDCAKLVEESCKALRCLVLKSESCKDRVITADGVAVIEKTMEENSTSQRWQTLLLDELFQ